MKRTELLLLLRPPSSADYLTRFAALERILRVNVCQIDGCDQAQNRWGSDSSTAETKEWTLQLGIELHGC
jgi:hypothetical protein